MKTRLLIALIIFTFVFVVCGFAQEQDAKEIIEKAMQQIKQVSPEKVKPYSLEEPLEKGEEVGEQWSEGPKDMNLVEIEGTIKEIAEDESYILVDETSIITNSDFLAYNPVKEGDQVVVMAALINEGIKAISISLAEQNKEENTEELSQPTGEGVESEDYISDDTQKEVTPEEESSQETPSENLPQDVIE